MVAVFTFFSNGTCLCTPEGKTPTIGEAERTHGARVIEQSQFGHISDELYLAHLAGRFKVIGGGT